MLSNAARGLTPALEIISQKAIHTEPNYMHDPCSQSTPSDNEAGHRILGFVTGVRNFGKLGKGSVPISSPTPAMPTTTLSDAARIWSSALIYTPGGMRHGKGLVPNSLLEATSRAAKCRRGGPPTVGRYPGTPAKSKESAHMAVVEKSITKT